jgi:hypothetical protein
MEMMITIVCELDHSQSYNWELASGPEFDFFCLPDAQRLADLKGTM